MTVRRLPEFPLSQDELAGFRLRARDVAATTTIGPHVRRHHGQSLEFRDYRDYAPGDDIRAVDWRATRRRHVRGPQDWVVKTFHAEERETLVVAVDLRPTMLLPDDAPKVWAALWTVQALGRVAAQSDSVLRVLPLYGDPALRLDASGVSTRGESDRLVERISKELQSDSRWTARPRLNAHDIEAVLPPASVLVVVSDLYLPDEEADALSDFLARAQRSYRHVAVIVPDSWPAERCLLERPFVLHAIEDLQWDDRPMEVDRSTLDDVAQRIEDLRTRIFSGAGEAGLSWETWDYPSRAPFDEDEMKDWFREHLLESSAMALALGGTG